MKEIKFILKLFTLTFIINVAVQAQPQERGERPSASEMVDRLLSDLGKEITLTDKEKSSLKEIFTDFHEKMDKMHEQGSRPDRDAMEVLQTERDKKVKEVLSEEKYKAYAGFMENHMKPPHGQDPPPPKD